MTWIDWLIGTLVVVSIPQGLRRGAGTTAGSAAGLVVAYAVASYTYAAVTDAVQQIPMSRPGWYNLNPVPAAWQATIAFLIIFLVMAAVLTILAGVGLGSLTPSRTSRLLGAAAGAFRGLLLSGAVLAVALGSPAGGPIASDVVRSTIAQPVAAGTSVTIEGINALLPPAYHVFGGPADRF